MLNPPIKLLGVKCERFLFYIKTGCISVNDPFVNYDNQVMTLQRQGVDVIRRYHNFGLLKIHGVSKIENEWHLVHFNDSMAEIQLGMHLSKLKKCYSNGKIINYNEKLSGEYLVKYHRNTLPEKSQNYKENCKAFSVCQQRKIPRPSSHNNYDDGRDHKYNSDFFGRDLIYYNKKFDGTRYKNFINGRKSFEGVPAFTSKQIFEQFETFSEFEDYVDSEKERKA